MRKTTLLTTVFITVLALFAGAVFASNPDWEAGVAAMQKRDFEAAVAAFQKVVESTPDAFQGHYMLGVTLGYVNRKEEALNHLRKAYDLNPNDLSIKLALGQAYLRVRRHADAAKLLGMVSSSDVGSLDNAKQVGFYQMRAGAREAAGDDNGAFADYKTLAGLKPSDAKVHFKVGVMANNRADMRTAVDSLGRASAAAPQDQEIKRAYVNVLKKVGRMTEDKTAKKQNYLKAVQIAKQLVALSASHENLLLLCEAELGSKMYPTAAETCAQAAAKKSSSWHAQFYLGQALTSNGKYPEAEAALNTALNNAKDPEAVNQVKKQQCFVFEKQKKYSDAISCYEKVGDGRGVARVKENEATAQENARIEAENAEIERMRKEAEALEKELKALEEGGGV